MPYLPNLIFTENHLDSKTSRILSQVVLKLKKRGYQCFLDEMPTKTTNRSHTRLIEQGEAEFKKVALKLKEKGIDINSPNSLNHPFFSTYQGLQLVPYIKRHRAQMQFKPLLESLRTHNMDYVAIDCQGEAAVREQFMAQKFQTEKSPFFSRIGREHARHIQEIILTKHSPQSAAEKYCFFDIFSDESAATQLKKSDLPLGVVSINATDLSDDEVVDKIIQQITVKSQKLSKSVAKTKPPVAKTIETTRKAPAKEPDFINQVMNPTYLTCLNMMSTSLAGIYFNLFATALTSVINYLGIFTPKKAPETVASQSKTQPFRKLL